VGVVFAAPAESGSMIGSADAAMYGAKRKGGGRAELFRPELHSAALHELETEQDLFHALESGALEVHYQPLVRVADRRISGFEALARWRHPVHGWISPTQFIPLAERSGLIAKCSKQVLDVAIARIAVWRRIHPALTISVNISVLDVANPALLHSLADALRKSGVPPEALCLEVTESRLMEPDDRAALRALRAMGVQIAIDDFGTGYSSLAYLREAPASTVKIDQSFVSPLGAAEPDRFFGAIEASGCETVQGYLVAAPMDEAAAELFLRDGSRWRGPATLARSQR
jgi:EAL domain-containing protein (putative c-di-GMP-specific phosphodiesterase class I)